MNASRRKRLEEAKELIEQAKSIVEEVAQEERESFDALPAGLQESENGQRSEEAASGLEGADGDLQTVLDSIEEALA